VIVPKVGKVKVRSCRCKKFVSCMLQSVMTGKSGCWDKGDEEGGEVRGQEKETRLYIGIHARKRTKGRR
jgi:hypothetical protein